MERPFCLAKLPLCIVAEMYVKAAWGNGRWCASLLDGQVTPAASISSYSNTSK